MRCHGPCAAQRWQGGQTDAQTSTRKTWQEPQGLGAVTPDVLTLFLLLSAPPRRQKHTQGLMITRLGI